LWKTLEEGEACSWWGQETFISDGDFLSTHRQGESSPGKWGTACPWWHSSYDPSSVLGFSTKCWWGWRGLYSPALVPGLGVSTQVSGLSYLAGDQVCDEQYRCPLRRVPCLRPPMGIICFLSTSVLSMQRLRSPEVWGQRMRGPHYSSQSTLLDTHPMTII
jgi:hypothetical protein